MENSQLGFFLVGGYPFSFAMWLGIHQLGDKHGGKIEISFCPTLLLIIINSTK
jgi:hypothetical protein